MSISWLLSVEELADKVYELQPLTQWDFVGGTQAAYAAN
jgi:hypothetical protein